MGFYSYTSDELETEDPQDYTMDKLPSKTLELLRALEEEFPDKIITKEMSPYQQGRLHGVIDLIRRLQELAQGE